MRLLAPKFGTERDHTVQFARVRGDRSAVGFKKYSGVYAPCDLDILQRVFDQLCRERRLALKDEEQREHLACEVIAAFDRGITDETELWKLLSKLRIAKKA